MMNFCVSGLRLVNASAAWRMRLTIAKIAGIIGRNASAKVFRMTFIMMSHCFGWDSKTVINSR